MSYRNLCPLPPGWRAAFVIVDDEPAPELTDFLNQRDYLHGATGGVRNQ